MRGGGVGRRVRRVRPRDGPVHLRLHTPPGEIYRHRPARSVGGGGRWRHFPIALLAAWRGNSHRRDGSGGREATAGDGDETGRRQFDDTPGCGRLDLLLGRMNLDEGGWGGGGHHNTLPKFGRECTTLLSIQIRATIVVRLDGVRNDVADFDVARSF